MVFNWKQNENLNITISSSQRKQFIAFLVIFAIIVCFFILHYLENHPSTDNAYVQTDVINVASEVTGPVAHIYVNDHEVVKKGQLLFDIIPLPFQFNVAKAVAAVAAAKAELVYANQNAGRIIRLAETGQESKETRDISQSRLDSAKAKLASAEAQLHQAQLDLEHTQIFALRPGIVTLFFLQPGNNIVANTVLFMIVEQDHFWVDANFKETQVERIRQGQPAEIVLDMYPKHVFHGVVDAVSAASGSVFSLLPPENASGNWVKVTQRFPVKVLINTQDMDYPLRIGATATVTIDTTHTTTSKK